MTKIHFLFILLLLSFFICQQQRTPQFSQQQPSQRQPQRQQLEGNIREAMLRQVPSPVIIRRESNEIDTAIGTHYMNVSFENVPLIRAPIVVLNNLNFPFIAVWYSYRSLIQLDANRNPINGTQLLLGDLNWSIDSLNINNQTKVLSLSLKGNILFGNKCTIVGMGENGLTVTHQIQFATNGLLATLSIQNVPWNENANSLLIEHIVFSNDLGCRPPLQCYSFFTESPNAISDSNQVPVTIQATNTKMPFTTIVKLEIPKFEQPLRHSFFAGPKTQNVVTTSQ